MHERRRAIPFAPAPGDVVSFGATGSSPLGHTGVVESASVDGSGNGSIRILSQNDTVDGGAPSR